MTQSPKIALVTGGSRGLGKNMAQCLARHGNDVIVTYLSREKEALSVVTEIKNLGRKAEALEAYSSLSSSSCKIECCHIFSKCFLL